MRVGVRVGVRVLVGVMVLVGVDVNVGTFHSVEVGGIVEVDFSPDPAWTSDLVGVQVGGRFRWIVAVGEGMNAVGGRVGGGKGFRGR